MVLLPYREIVGALNDLVSGSRPDLAHVVRNLGQHLSNYTESHCQAVKRVLRYPQHTKDYGLMMRVNDDANLQLVRLEVYADADYANDSIDRPSVSGYVTMADGNVISYGSRKQ